MSVYSEEECFHCPDYPRGCSLYYFTLGQEVEEIERNATMFDQEIVLLVGNIFTFSCLNLTEGSETWTEFLEVSLVRRPSHAGAVQHSWSSL